MGDLLFNVSHAAEFDPRVFGSAYITGIEGIPWHCRHNVDGDQFSIGREIEESGKLNIVWPTRTLGNICLSTTSLRISPERYCLVVELARGTVHRLKAQVSEWQRIGLRLPDTFYPIAESALEKLLRALTTTDTSQREQLAQASIDLSLKASVELCNCYGDQALEARSHSEGRLTTLLGVELSPGGATKQQTPALKTTFNLLSIPADLGSVETASGKRNFTPFDQQVAWAQREEKKVCIGPLVNFHRDRLPQWMVLLDEGFESVLKTACEHAEECVARFKGKAHLWNCAAGLNVPGAVSWSDEEILRMAVSLIETVRRSDQHSPVLLTIDQPWSEYLRGDPDGISPLHFADALIRADLGLSGLAIDLRFGTEDAHSFPRDPIEISRLIDRWSMLGLPLMVYISAPTQPDAYAAAGGRWETPIESEGIVPPETLLKLLLSKACIHAVVWNQMQDQQRQVPAGLWDTNGHPKPILSSLHLLRGKFLH